MPLPANSSISLQGHSRPGEGITTMPKIAMVVRMTEETLDALQNLSAADRMDFEFGEKPGIFVHGQHFPMRYDKEKDNQELFIRTTMAARPNAPLKLNANVIGKFAVKQVLSDQISQRLHNTTAAVAKRPKIQLVDAPTAAQSSGPPKKKVPKSTTTTGKSTPTIVKSYTTPAQTPAPTIAASASSVSLPKDVVLTYRQRLIHYLALGAAAEEDIFKEYGGKDIDTNTRAALTDLLNEVAEPEQVSRKVVSSNSAAKWQLKPRTWLEVRPYHYQDYTDNVRTRVARLARSWLQSLRIPESDPSWEYVKFRDSGSGGAAANTAQRSVNGTSSTAAKAKVKAKAGKAKEIDMKIKSEAAPPTRAIPPSAALPPKPNAPTDRMTPPVRNSKGKEREADTEKEEGELSASQTPPRVSAVRRMPGSRPPRGSTPTMPPPSAPPLSQPVSSSQSSTSVAAAKRTGPVDARGPRRAPPEPSERARPAPPIPPPAPVEKKTVVHVKEEIVRVKKERASPPADSGYAASGSSVRSAKEREPIRRERGRESDRESLRPPRRERERESDRETLKGREGDRKPKDKDVGREREREKEKPKERAKEREQVPLKTTAKTSAKRKLSESSDEESSDWGYEDRRSIRKSSVTASTTKVKRERESVPLKSSAVMMKSVKRDSTPPKRHKRDASPLPPTKIKSSVDRKAIAGSSSSVSKVKKELKPEGGSSRLSKSLKRRRSSIDFTSSSESEDEVPRPKASKPATKVSTLLPPKPSQSKTVASSATGVPVTRTRPVKPLPALSKNETLRLRYSDKYEEYISTFQKLNTLKKKFTTIVRYGSESLSGESDADMDMISLDELQDLAAKHQRLRSELEGIEKEYMN